MQIWFTKKVLSTTFDGCRQAGESVEKKYMSHNTVIRDTNKGIDFKVIAMTAGDIHYSEKDRAYVVEYIVQADTINYIDI